MRNTFKLIFVLLLLMMMVILPVSAQDATPEVTAEATPDGAVLPEVVQVDGLELRFSDDGAVVHIVGRIMNGCDLPLNAVVVREDGVLNIELTQVGFDPDAPCTRALLPFEYDVPLEGGIVNQLLINANNTSVLVDAPADAALSYVPLERVAVNLGIENILQGETAGTLVINAALPDGCEDPVHVRQRVDAEAQLIVIDVFITRPTEPRVCTMMLIPFEQTITLPEDLTGFYQLAINGGMYLYDFDISTLIYPGGFDGETFRSPMIIDSVEVLLLESAPVQVVVNVRGSQPDGCEFPAVTEERRDGNAITLEIYREVPLAAMCPAVLVTYEDSINLGMFEPGSYTVTVNGVTVEFEI